MITIDTLPDEILRLILISPDLQCIRDKDEDENAEDAITIIVYRISQTFTRLVCKRWFIIIGDEYQHPYGNIYFLIALVIRGHVNLCRLGLEWECDNPNYVGILNQILQNAAYCEQEACCRLALELGATNVNEMLLIVTELGNIALCRIAKKLGADDFERMMVYSIFSTKNSNELNKLAKLWSSDVDADIE